MPSSVVIVTAIASLLGFAINVLVMSNILLKGRREYHLLFSLLLLIAACWDLGILLMMIRNDYPNEIVEKTSSLFKYSGLVCSCVEFHLVSSITMIFDTV